MLPGPAGCGRWLVRAGFRSILADRDDIEVAGGAADGQAAVSACRELRPDVVLMDIRMPGMDGLETPRVIAGDERLGSVNLVVLTTFDVDDHVYGELGGGATGFLVRETEPEDRRNWCGRYGSPRGVMP